MFEIELSGANDIFGSQWDNVAISRSLVQFADALVVKPISKNAAFRYFLGREGAPEKIENLAILQDGSLMLINDNDSGIRGDETCVLVVKGAVQADPVIWRK